MGTDSPAKLIATLRKVNVKEKIKEKQKINARKALEEAAERKNKSARVKLPKELDGRDGPEPTRFNDWEKNGITSDF